MINYIWHISHNMDVCVPSVRSDGLKKVVHKINMKQLRQDAIDEVNEGILTGLLTTWPATAQSLMEPQEDHAVIREGQEGWGWEMTYPDCENDNESVFSSDVKSDHSEIKLDELASEGNITDVDEHGVVAPVDDAIRILCGSSNYPRTKDRSGVDF